ncbi:UNVERIFIED_CONTAM: hypothetical protein GTU68_036878, partial [Idotea baltica]|nr:hypothetical protein [Idotea baltica]
MSVNPSLLQQKVFIGGVWQNADSGQTIGVTNPATGETIGTVPYCGRPETARAIAAAETAFAGWKALTAEARANHMHALCDAIMDHLDDLAVLLTTEMGKPVAEAKGEISLGVKYIRFFAEEGKRIYGDTIPSPWADRRILVTKEPVGVAGSITPWNFPNSMIARKLGAALASGCTMVMKPAEFTPFSALVYGVMAEKSGLPAGVINIITGDAPAIGEEMCENPALRKLTGPLINEAAVDKVADHVKDALSKGGELVSGGARPQGPGTFYEPTLIKGATAEMKVAHEETFGPLAALFRFETEDEAVRLANDTEYGLACYFYTQDLGRTYRVMERLQYGLVGVNEGVITTEVAPFG